MQSCVTECCAQVKALLQNTWKEEWSEERKLELQTCLERDFPPTDYVCNSDGLLIHFEGTYDVEKHREAWERSKKWLPLWVGDLKWVSKTRGSFKRITRIVPVTCFDKPGMFTIRRNQTDEWYGGLPPTCIGMLGKCGGKNAVVVGQTLTSDIETQMVGIGDNGCLFKDFKSQNRVMHLGLTNIETKKKKWKIQTKRKVMFIADTSTRFKRSRRVIRDINRTDLIEKHLNSVDY
jgi:hypothetical protein